jgi:N-acyl amino acid synthase of PEP-CTERM/exosortase system
MAVNPTSSTATRSVACLRRRGTGELVGCARLIVARPENPDYPLPFEQSSKEVLDRSIVDPARLPRNTVGEVSRLAVLGAFRQRKGEASAPVSVTEDDFGTRGPHARFPFIPVSSISAPRPWPAALASNMSLC